MPTIRFQEVSNIFPPFEELIPSTITLISSLSHPVDLKQAFFSSDVLKDPTLSEENSLARNRKLKFPLVKEVGILSIRIKEKSIAKTTIETNDEEVSLHSASSQNEEIESSIEPIRCNDPKTYWLCRGIVGNKPFSTSLAIDFSGGEKNFSVKVFPNGKFQITGCRSFDEAYGLITHLLNVFKKAGATDEEAVIEWLDPQTINYRYETGFKINLSALNQILYENKMFQGYDNLLSRKVEIILPSGISKSHLKSRKPALQRISIYASGKIVQGGPSFEELGENYRKLTEIFSLYIDEIKEKVKTGKTNKQIMEERIVDLFKTSDSASREPNDLLTPKEIMNLLELNDKKELNRVLQGLINKKVLIRIKEANGANPRYRLREKGEPAEKIETFQDGKARPKVDEGQLLEMLGNVMEGYRSRELSNSLIGNDLRSSISSINSILYRLEKEDKIEKVLIADDEPRWRLL